MFLFSWKKMKKIGEDEEYTGKEIKELFPEKEKEEEINQFQKKIMCPICKSANSDTESHCRYCGTALNYDLETNL